MQGTWGKGIADNLQSSWWPTLHNTASECSRDPAQQQRCSGETLFLSLTLPWPWCAAIARNSGSAIVWSPPIVSGTTPAASIRSLYLRVLEKKQKRGAQWSVREFGYCPRSKGIQFYRWHS